MSESNYWINVTAARPCQHCGKTDWCTFSHDGKFEICRRESSPQAEYKSGTHGEYWLYALNGASANNAPGYTNPAPPPTSSQRAEPATLDRVYRALLNELGLDESHKENLLERGLPVNEITRRMYRSWPGRGRVKTCRTLLEQFDAATLAKIPGFYLKESEDGGEKYYSLSGKSGLVIPVRDAERRIIALKIRADALDASGVRYRWISSARHDGPGPGAPIHVPGIDDVVTDYIAAGRPVRITEGELKADIATVLSEILTISIPGVRNWRGAFAWLQTLEPKPPIKLAFDADAQTNRHVAESLHDIFEALSRNGFHVELELWETDAATGEPKGIDDALKAGASIAVYDGDSVAVAIEEINKAARAANPPAHEVKANAALDALDNFDKHAADPEWFDKTENLDALALVREQRPSHWALKIKPVLKKHGMVREIEKLIDAHAAIKQSTAAIIPFPQPTNGNGAASTAGDKPSESPETVLEEINREYAVTSIGSNVLILRERFDPEQNRQEVDFLRRADFNLLFENRYVTTTTESGEPHRENAATFWRRHPRRRSYKQVIFAPGVDEPHYFNLWRGFAVEPESGDWSLFRDHIYNVICNGDAILFDYVQTWMANAVQNPNERPGTALVLRGKQGTGKSIFCREFGALFGQHFRQISNARHLVGNFNSHLKDCLLLFADEAFWAGDKSSEGSLKSLITEPEIVIEAKGRDAVTVPNRVRLLISSNCEWVIPAGLDERRFCVTEVSDSRIQDHHYFNAIIEQMKNGGRAAMLHYLLNHHSDINLRSIPKTAALFDQKLHSFDAITKFWFEILWNGRLVECDDDWTGQVARSSFYESYFRKTEKAGIRNRSFEVEFGIKLRKLCPSTIPTQNIYTDSGRERGWEFQPLQQCRLEFEQAVNMKINWHNSDSEEIEDIFDAATKSLNIL